jgi:hypothetical protein
MTISILKLEEKKDYQSQISSEEGNEWEVMFAFSNLLPLLKLEFRDDIVNLHFMMKVKI